MFSIYCLVLLFTSQCSHAYLRKPVSVIKKRLLSGLDEFNVQDLNNIQKYNHLFEYENYNDFIKHITNKEISKIFIESNYRKLISVSVDNINIDGFYNHYHITNIDPVTVPNIVEKASDLSIPIFFANFNPSMEIFYRMVSFIFNVGIPIFLLIFVSTSFMRNLGQLSNNMNMFGNKIGGVNKFIKPNVSLDSWAGSPEVLDECKEIVSYVENQEIYKTLGAEMPRGILLEGPPGTGKTLLAKAIASETNSTFISVAGSEFVEIFVGMGASKVRDLFKNARQNKPCIIFIDEIDAVGKQRGVGLNSNDEREQTLNQILYEMDGFNNNDDIIILAATNRKDVLDQALLRPGRFDRIIKVPLPDKYSRERILEYYLSLKKLETPFDISSIAELTDGMSGAQLKNIINEAAILSARNNCTTLQEKYIFDAFEKSIVGLIKTNSSIAEVTRKRVAIHESGHLILCLLFPENFEFKKASIQPTYNGAGGYTIYSENPVVKESGLYTKDMLKKKLIITMGGKAAESIYYGDDHVSLGAIQDLKQANQLAKRMIGNFGMGDLMEVFYDENTGDDANPYREQYSENTKITLDKEKLQLVRDAYKEAKIILQKNITKLIYFSNLLMNKTVVYKTDVY